MKSTTTIRRRNSERVAWGLTAIATVTAVVLGVLYFRGAAADVLPIRLSVSPPQNIAFSTSSPVAVVSPDGRRVA
jgi:hypothetical protein